MVMVLRPHRGYYERIELATDSPGWNYTHAFKAKISNQGPHSTGSTHIIGLDDGVEFYGYTVPRLDSVEEETITLG
jgi:hypothetical protein